MRLTIQLKLQPTPEQAGLLRRTLEAANAACNAISNVAWYAHEFKQFGIHKLTYYDTKAAFGLSAQLVVRCIAKVADAYKVDKKIKRTFKPLGAVAFDDRMLSYKASSVSIWTPTGRQTIPFVCGERQRVLLAHRVGESDLVVVRGAWYLLTTADVTEQAQQSVTDVVGIDLGVTNIATDSDGVIHQATTIKHVRYRHRRLRQRLQKERNVGQPSPLACACGTRTTVRHMGQSQRE
jgi:transposase